MVQSQLSAYSGSDPVWGFVALVGSDQFTGEAAVGLDPRVRLFAVEGRIYFAEREDDAPAGTRLVNCGAMSANQLARGAVQAGGHQSLARLFQRDATIDRDAVELTINASTESLLASIAQNPVGMPEVFPLRHHPAGIHHWLQGAPPVAAAEHGIEEVAPEADVPQSDSIESVFPAPMALTDTAVPEWPRVDDEPLWAVPADARELAPVLEPPVLAERVVAEAAIPITAAQLPQLAALSSIQPPPVAVALFPPAAEPTSPAGIDPTLPKLAAGPMSINDLKQDLKKASAASEPWTSSSKSMAAVKVWEMVDDVFDDGKTQEPRVGNGAPQVRSRGWLRKKS